MRNYCFFCYHNKLLLCRTVKNIDCEVKIKGNPQHCQPWAVCMKHQYGAIPVHRIANGTISPFLLTLAYRYVSAIVPLTSLLVRHAYGPMTADVQKTLQSVPRINAIMYTVSLE